MAILLKATESIHSDAEAMTAILRKVGRLLSLLFRVSVGPPAIDMSTASFERHSALPLPSEWQSPIERKLAQRTLNLCIGYSVPTSTLGWKNDTLSLEAMMKSYGPNFFGMKIEEMILCGVIPETAETELASQLQVLQEVLNGVSIVEFYKNGIGAIKEADWYNRAIEQLNRHGGPSMLSSGGEEDAILLLLHFSNLCLNFATAPGESDAAAVTCRKRGLLKMALSIILPIVSIPCC